MALEAATTAGRLLRRRLGGVRASHKGDVDLVTEADHEAERAILDLVHGRFPSHRIIAEESGEHGIPGEAVWYVDPLDGTTNFVHAFPHFAVSIAVITNDGFATAVVHDPLRGETFRASRGRGAFLNDQPMMVSSTGRLADALVATGFPYDRRSAPQRYLQPLERMLRNAQGIRRVGAASLDLAYLACGRLDAYWEEQLRPWDTAAGSLLVTEAGGLVTAFDGSTGYPLFAQIAASNGRFHEELLRAIAG